RVGALSPRAPDRDRGDRDYRLFAPVTKSGSDPDFLFLLVADIHGHARIDARRLEQGVDLDRALERMALRPWTIGERGDPDLVEHVDVAPHARGGRERGLGLGAEVGDVRAAHGICEAVAVLRSVAAPEGVE